MRMKKEGLADIARKFGVAPSTVSRAIHGNSRISSSLRKEIIKYVSETGYLLPSPRRNTVGLAFSSFGVQGYCPELLLAFRLAVTRYGLRLELIVPESLEQLDFRIYRGIVTFLMSHEELTTLCGRAACPVITVNDPRNMVLSNYSIVSNDVQGIFDAGELLHRAGHSRIAMLICENNMNYNNRNRYAGYEQFCRAKHIPPLFAQSSHREPDIIAAVREVMANGATGLILRCSFNASYLFHKAGIKIPDDLSVVLHCDETPREEDPFFFTVTQDFEQIAESALEIIELLHKGEPPPIQLSLPYRTHAGHSIKTVTRDS